jgi:hypothetical protein
MAVLKYYNTTTSAWEYIAASTTANFTTWKKTAAGGETYVSGTDDNAVTLSYTVGLEQVFINGVLQVRGSDYTATTGTSITGLTALIAGDIVTVVCYAPFNIANTIAPTVIDAKGDLLAGTAADTVGRLAVGTNDFVLVAASGETTGLKWADVGLGAWTTWTPTFTNFTLGNGTVIAYYKQYGKLVVGQIRVVLGSTSSVTGIISISIPITHSNNYASNPDVGFGRNLDDNLGTAYRSFVDIDLTNDRFRIFSDNVASTYATLGGVSGTIPFTWTTSDAFSFSFAYEAA